MNVISRANFFAQSQLFLGDVQIWLAGQIPHLPLLASSRSSSKTAAAKHAVRTHSHMSQVCLCHSSGGAALPRNTLGTS